MASSAAYFDDEPHSPDTPPPISPSTLPQAEVPEVSLVEEEATTGVTFTPEYGLVAFHNIHIADQEKAMDATEALGFVRLTQRAS